MFLNSLYQTAAVFSQRNKHKYSSKFLVPNDTYPLNWHAVLHRPCRFPVTSYYNIIVMQSLQMYQHTKIQLNWHVPCTPHQINMLQINILDPASGQNNQNNLGVGSCLGARYQLLQPTGESSADLSTWK